MALFPAYADIDSEIEVYEKQFTEFQDEVYQDKSSINHGPQPSKLDNKDKRFATNKGRKKDILFGGDFRSLKLEEVIYVDKQPDQNNSIFCNTHYTDIARYHRLRSSPMGLCYPRKKKKKHYRYYSKVGRELPDSTSVKKLVEYNLNLDYIPFSFPLHEEQSIKEVSQCDNINSIISKEISKNVGLNLEFVCEKEYWQNLNRTFNENLTKEPNNVPLWLKFVDMQDKVVTHCFGGNDSKITSRERNNKLITERKISVLEKAISKNSKIIELQLKRLSLGEIIWEKEKLKSEWSRVTFLYPNNINIWFNYLLFYQTYFPIFHMNNVLIAYSKCSDKLIQMKREIFLSHQPPEDLVFSLINMTTQLSFIWYQGGFIERSIGLFQALIELNFYCPKEMRGPNFDFSSKIDIFEAFWDSKAPRFGEESSIGWEKFMEKRDPVKFSDKILQGTHDEEDEIILKGGSKDHLWLEIEKSRERNHWLPWQEDPEYCEDLERMVSFSVIKRYLFILNSDEEAFYLMVQFLNFLGVIIPRTIAENEIIHKSFDSVFFPMRVESLETLTSKEEYINNFFKLDYFGPSIYRAESDVYFEFVSSVIKKFILIISSPFKNKLAIIYISFLTKRCLTLKKQNRENWESLYKTYKKNIKNLLKESEFRNDYEIYFEYAQFQACMGNYDEACKIHSTIIQSTLADIADIFAENKNTEMLWTHLHSLVRIRIEIESFSEKNMTELLNLICNIILDKLYSYSDCSSKSGQILRLRKKLYTFVKGKLDYLLQGHVSQFKIHHGALAILSLVLLLTEGFDASRVMFEEFLNMLCPQTECQNEEIARKEKSHYNSQDTCVLLRAKESLYKNYLWMINITTKKTHFHINSPLLRSTVKQIINSAILIAPSNFDFLENLAEYQTWRDILCGSGFQSGTNITGTGILAIIFRILPHIRKVSSIIKNINTDNISSTHQLRSFLEAAVLSDVGKHCPFLWRIYLKLISLTKPNELVSLSYRALHSCPFAKSLYLDCIELIPEKMMDIMRMMNEKGIRVRLPLEELEVLLEEENETIEEN